MVPSKSAHLGCYGHLNIVKEIMQKNSRTFVALRIFDALQGVQNGQDLNLGLEIEYNLG